MHNLIMLWSTFYRPKVITMTQIIEQDMSEKLCIVTGANSGVGKESARKLIKAGAHLVMVCRNPQKAAEARKELLEDKPDAKIEILIADLSLISDTKKVAQQIIESYPKIDVLINNAGAHIMGRELTSEGYEMNFAINYLGPFVLLNLLLPRLLESGPSRIVVVASEAHRIGSLLSFRDFQSEKSPNALSYMRAKYYVMLLVQSISKQLAGSQTSINAVCPGLVASNFFSVEPFKTALSLLAKTGIFTINTPEKGSRSSIKAACEAEYANSSGNFLASYPLLNRLKPAKQIYNTEKQNALWAYGLQITGLNFPESTQSQSAA